MFGRYGTDQLSVFLLAVYVILAVISRLSYHLYFLSWVALIPLVLAVLRMFSRNLERRRAENAKFLSLASPFVRWFKLRRTIQRDKDHCYVKCPNCGQYLRVPRGKGKITVTCRNCGVSFEEKS